MPVIIIMGFFLHGCLLRKGLFNLCFDLNLLMVPCPDEADREL